eukprot:7493025-Pyramimonas_sp.AAC.1
MQGLSGREKELRHPALEGLRRREALANPLQNLELVLCDGVRSQRGHGTRLPQGDRASYCPRAAFTAKSEGTLLPQNV